MANDLILLGEQLTKEAIDSPTPCVETCQDLVKALTKEQMTISLLQTTRIGLTVGKAVKAFKRHKRTDGEAWSSVLESSETLVKSWKAVAATAADDDKKSNKKAAATTLNNTATGPPTTVAEYRARLTKYNKDLYKDPPILPPRILSIDSTNYGEPKRDKNTGLLNFVSGKDEAVKLLLQDFHPNRTPEEVLRAGAFGGTYFRAIHSGVTNMLYKPDEVLADSVHHTWIKGLNAKTMLTSLKYQPVVNKFGVKCGGSLGMWESSGWITEIDPYGWFQWYCRFYQGRRCEDDARQISRWSKSAGPKGRFRSQLCNKILAANTKCDDTKISPVIRQTMLHWGLEITKDVLEKHRKRVGK